MGARSTDNGRETSTRGVHREPPPPKKLWIKADSVRKPTQTVPPPSTSRRSPSKTPFGMGAIIALVIVAIVLVAVLAGGAGSSKTRVRTVTVTKPATSTPQVKEVPIPALKDVTGVSATASLVALSGTTVRLTVSAVSDSNYAAVLITPPKKAEVLVSNTAGRSQFIHRLTIQHLLAYKWLRIYTIRAGMRILKPALQIETAFLAEGVMRHEPPS